MSSSTAAAASHPMAVTASVTVRLNHGNYMLWRAQMITHLRSHPHLLGHVDGTTKAPADTIEQTTGTGADAITAIITNPDYATWYVRDQTVLSGFFATVTEEVLATIMGAATAHDAWLVLESMFASRSKARIIQIRTQLTAAKKKGTPAADYFRHMKSLADTLAAIGKPLREEETISYILAGLGPDYDPLVTSLTTRNDDITLDEVYSHLLAFEHRHEQHDAEIQLAPGGHAVNFTGRQGGGDRQHGGGQGGGRGHGGRGRGRNGRGGGRGAPLQGRGGYGPQGQTGGQNQHGGGRPQCQICNKAGHTAMRCYNRYNHAYNDDDPSAPLPHAGYNVNVDPTWYLDTGATDHITADLDRLAVRETYNGNERVHVGNGAGLHISHVGHGTLNTTAKPLALHNILHVPNITKNLLSAHKLSKDNSVFIEIHPFHFIVKDRDSRRRVLQGKCDSSGLYPIHPSRINAGKCAMFSASSATTSKEQWHRRLGHPSLQVVNSILRINNLKFCNNSAHAHVCNACQMAKSHQLSFPISNHVSTAPLELIFTDVWGPAIPSASGFKYYVSFIDDFTKFT
jgi:histone deacetylase 1/2